MKASSAVLTVFDWFSIHEVTPKHFALILLGSITRISGSRVYMYGYTDDDMDEMIGGIQMAIAHYGKDEQFEQEVEWLNKAMEFLQQVCDEFYTTN